MNIVLDFLINNFQNCLWLLVILVAMCPALESKIAIPLALNSAFWGSNVLTPFYAFLLSFLASIIPYYFIVFVIRHIKKRTTGFISDKFFYKYSSKVANFQGKPNDLKKYLALTAFVAVPLPLTGVWTGSLIVGLSNLNIHYSFLAVSIGALLSSASITLLCSVFKNSIPYIFMISLFLIILFMSLDLLISMIKRKY